MKRIEVGAGEATLNYEKEQGLWALWVRRITRQKGRSLSPSLSTWSIHIWFLQLQKSMKNESEDLWELKEQQVGTEYKPWVREI